MRNKNLSPKKVNKILEDMLESMDMPKTIRIELKPYKSRIALTLISKETIRLNKNLLDEEWAERVFGAKPEEAISRVLKHELLHIKLNTRRHPPDHFSGPH